MQCRKRELLRFLSSKTNLTTNYLQGSLLFILYSSWICATAKTDMPFLVPSAISPFTITIIAISYRIRIAIMYHCHLNTSSTHRRRSISLFTIALTILVKLKKNEGRSKKREIVDLVCTYVIVTMMFKSPLTHTFSTRCDFSLHIPDVRCLLVSMYVHIFVHKRLKESV